MAYQFKGVCGMRFRLHFVAIWQKYEYFESDKNFKNCQKVCKKWLINASEELVTRSAKFDTGTSLNKF